jgi:hypothetical protein
MSSLSEQSAKAIVESEGIKSCLDWYLNQQQKSDAAYLNSEMQIAKSLAII